MKMPKIKLEMWRSIKSKGVIFSFSLPPIERKLGAYEFEKKESESEKGSGVLENIEEQNISRYEEEASVLKYNNDGNENQYPQNTFGNRNISPMQIQEINSYNRDMYSKSPLLINETTFQKELLEITNKFNSNFECVDNKLSSLLNSKKALVLKSLFLLRLPK